MAGRSSITRNIVLSVSSSITLFSSIFFPIILSSSLLIYTSIQIPLYFTPVLIDPLDWSWLCCVYWLQEFKLIPQQCFEWLGVDDLNTITQVHAIFDDSEFGKSVINKRFDEEDDVINSFRTTRSFCYNVIIIRKTSLTRLCLVQFSLFCKFLSSISLQRQLPDDAKLILINLNDHKTCYFKTILWSLVSFYKNYTSTGFENNYSSWHKHTLCPLKATFFNQV